MTTCLEAMPLPCVHGHVIVPVFPVSLLPASFLVPSHESDCLEPRGNKLVRSTGAVTSVSGHAKITFRCLIKSHTWAALAQWWSIWISKNVRVFTSIEATIALNWDSQWWSISEMFESPMSLQLRPGRNAEHFRSRWTTLSWESWCRYCRHRAMPFMILGRFRCNFFCKMIL
jgi:hypothetical protein